MEEKECKDIYYYADEAYKLAVNTYLDNAQPDRDIDIIATKFDNIIMDICPEYIMYDDLAEQLIIGDMAVLTDFAYYMDYLGIELKLIELIEDPRKYCNFYLTEILWYKLGEILTGRLEHKIADFENEYREKNQSPDTKEAEEHYRKMVKDTLLN